MKRRATPTRIERRSDFDEASDTDLVRMTRAGEQGAFAELWRRHHGAARSLAHSRALPADVDDLVAEAFTRLYAIIRRGGGPTDGFRPYLFTTIRNIASNGRRPVEEVPIGTAEEIPTSADFVEQVHRSLDYRVTIRAFQALPARSRAALWFVEVERLSHRQAAQLLNVKTTSVAMLAHRAREHFREQWIREHLRRFRLKRSDCAWTAHRLPGFIRGNLAKRERLRLDRHLSGCVDCQDLASRARAVNARLILVLMPFAVGFASWMQAIGAGLERAALPA
jgi:RNA polymerase sigma factor (sigma-70 family)